MVNRCSCRATGIPIVPRATSFECMEHGPDFEFRWARLVIGAAAAKSGIRMDEVEVLTVDEMLESMGPRKRLVDIQ